LGKEATEGTKVRVTEPSLAPFFRGLGKGNSIRFGPHCFSQTFRGLGMEDLEFDEAVEGPAQRLVKLPSHEVNVETHERLII